MIYDFRGDLTGFSAKTEALVIVQDGTELRVLPGNNTLAIECGCALLRESRSLQIAFGTLQCEVYAFHEQNPRRRGARRVYFPAVLFHARVRCIPQQSVHQMFFEIQICLIKLEWSGVRQSVRRSLIPIKRRTIQSRSRVPLPENRQVYRAFRHNGVRYSETYLYFDPMCLFTTLPHPHGHLQLHELLGNEILHMYILLS